MLGMSHLLYKQLLVQFSENNIAFSVLFVVVVVVVEKMQGRSGGGNENVTVIGVCTKFNFLYFSERKMKYPLPPNCVN